MNSSSFEIINIQIIFRGLSSQKSRKHKFASAIVVFEVIVISNPYKEHEF